MNEHKPKNYHFLVDNKKFDTEHASLNGQEIKVIAGVPANYQLFLEEQGESPDRAISDGDGLDLHNPPKHFYAVPPATFGRK